ncbi:MAG: sigma-54-dependent transcriptional regulator [Vicinamibacterales bacterium]
MNSRIAIVDDEPRMVEILRMVLSRDGYDAVAFSRAADFHTAHDAQAFDAVITDLRMPDEDGLTLLKRVRGRDPQVPVILMTAHASVPTAVAAMRDGAFDYIEKPFDNAELKTLVERALTVTRLSRENRYLRSELRSRYSPAGMVAESASMREVLTRCRRVAPTPSTVLITGESGTGKELVARALHYHSARVDGPFVAVNCTAFAEGVLESELFGHERGAFTGATQSRPGVFERAQGGTLFLDEIGEVSDAFQAKLLRVLQEREVVRVGGAQARPVDVRLVAATHRDLRADVASGRFREDFYFRLAVIPIHLPPLRERREDVLPLARHFLAKWNVELGRHVRDFAPDVVAHFAQADWPGNVRELENTVERGVVLAEGDHITLADIAAAGAHAAEQPPLAALRESNGTLQAFLDRAAAEVIRHTLRDTGGARQEAARRLGVERTTLYRLMRKYGLGDD